MSSDSSKQVPPDEILPRLWEIYERVQELGSDYIKPKVELNESQIQELQSMDTDSRAKVEQLLETEIIRILMRLGNERHLATKTPITKAPQAPSGGAPVEDSGNMLSNLFRIFTHLDFEEEKAINYWNEIIEHEAEMNKKLGRRAGLRVAMMDYFTNFNRLFDNPKIIEINVFDDMVRMSFVDELTGIYNRRFFNHAIHKEVNRCSRHDRPVSLLIFDVDNFKHYNDTYGHSAGDVVLRLIGQTMESTFRVEDSVCRIGGEEFGVILPEVGKDSAFAATHRFRTALEETTKKNAEEVIRVSGGISSLPDDGDHPDELYRKADACLYKAKQAGKDRFFFEQTA